MAPNAASDYPPGEYATLLRLEKTGAFGRGNRRLGQDRSPRYCAPGAASVAAERVPAAGPRQAGGGLHLPQNCRCHRPGRAYARGSGLYRRYIRKHPVSDRPVAKESSNVRASCAPSQTNRPRTSHTDHASRPALAHRRELLNVAYAPSNGSTPRALLARGVALVRHLFLARAESPGPHARLTDPLP